MGVVGGALRAAASVATSVSEPPDKAAATKAPMRMYRISHLGIARIAAERIVLPAARATRMIRVS
jgi:hypothetical protein